MDNRCRAMEENGAKETEEPKKTEETPENVAVADVQGTDPVEHPEEHPDAKQNPYAYLDRNDFTSEKYKVEVRNLPKHYGFAVS